MKIWNRVKLNIQDVGIFGPKILLRHVARITGAETASVHMLSLGEIHLRPRESDVSTFRDIFGNDYAAQSVPTVSSRLHAVCDAILAKNKKPVIIDAGANVGAASLWFRDRFPEAAIVAVEPEKNNLRVLHKNLDGRPDIYIMDAAIGSTPGFVEVSHEGLHDNLSWGSQTVRVPQGVPIVTVDDAVAVVPEAELFIVKIDIEGFEQDLFRENVGWIDHTTMIIVEPHDWLIPGRRTSRCFQKEMGQRDFDIFVCGENLVYVRSEV